MLLREAAWHWSWQWHLDITPKPQATGPRAWVANLNPDTSYKHCVRDITADQEDIVSQDWDSAAIAESMMMLIHRNPHFTRRSDSLMKLNSKTKPYLCIEADMQAECTGLCLPWLFASLEVHRQSSLPWKGLWTVKQQSCGFIYESTQQQKNMNVSSLITHSQGELKKQCVCFSGEIWHLITLQLSVGHSVMSDSLPPHGL